MYTIDYQAIIAIALIALVLVFIRISWTLKEISDALARRTLGETRPEGAQRSPAPAAGMANATGGTAPTETNGSSSDAAGPDEAELVAVIAIAHAAMREAV